MPLLNDALSVWEIGFRWASRDPDGWRWRIPLPVRDNFRVLMDAILSAQLPCLTVSLEKWDPESGDPPEVFVRHHLDKVKACIDGVRYDRALLRWARIEQADLRQWCERRTIPLPEFWFPAGWSEYRWPDDESAKEGEAAGAAADVKVEEDPTVGGLRPVQRAKIACQEIALAIWKGEPDLTIAAMVERDEIRRLGGGARWVPEVVGRWLSEVDPRDPRTKRGKRKGS